MTISLSHRRGMIKRSPICRPSPPSPPPAAEPYLVLEPPEQTVYCEERAEGTFEAYWEDAPGEGPYAIDWQADMGESPQPPEFMNGVTDSWHWDAPSDPGLCTIVGKFIWTEDVWIIGIVYVLVEEMP